MFKYWYRRILIMIVVFLIAAGGGYYLIEAQKYSIRQEVIGEAASDSTVIPGGMPVGIYLETDGVMILGTESIEGIDGMEYNPAEHLVKSGDYIVGLKDRKSVV